MRVTKNMGVIGRFVFIGALTGSVLLFFSVRDLLIRPIPGFEELKFAAFDVAQIYVDTTYSRPITKRRPEYRLRLVLSGTQEWITFEKDSWMWDLIRQLQADSIVKVWYRKERNHAFYGSDKWYQIKSEDIFQIGTSNTVVMSYKEWKRYRLRVAYWFLGIGSLLSGLCLPLAYRILRRNLFESRDGIAS